MKKKKKINTKKFTKRIVQLIIIIVIIILSIKLLTPKKQENDEMKLILNNVDVTENLISNMYIDKENDVYLSTADIKNLFDSSLYYEDTTNKIITTCKVKVGAIDLSNNILELNTASIVLPKPVLNYGETQYIPLSELASLYNIEISANKNNAIINSLYNELITVKTSKKISLKEKTSIFSSTIEKIEKDEKMIFIENAEKEGWIKVLTYNGNFGYIKENSITDKNQERTTISDSAFATNKPNLDNAIEINKKDITTEKLTDFNTRKALVNDLVSKVISKEKFTININLKDATVEKEKLERFIIELLPRIREIGASLSITNNNILDQNFLSSNNI